MIYDITKMGQYNTIIEPCEVLNIPAGSAPKVITVRQPGSDGAAMDVWWNGQPEISTGYFVAIQKRGVSGGQYVVIGVSGESSAAGVGYKPNVKFVSSIWTGADYITLTAALAGGEPGGTIFLLDAEIHEIANNSATTAVYTFLGVDREKTIITGNTSSVSLLLNANTGGIFRNLTIYLESDNVTVVDALRCYSGGDLLLDECDLTVTHTTSSVTAFGVVGYTGTNLTMRNCNTTVTGDGVNTINVFAVYANNEATSIIIDGGTLSASGGTVNNYAVAGDGTVEMRNMPTVLSGIVGGTPLAGRWQNEDGGLQLAAGAPNDGDVPTWSAANNRDEYAAPAAGGGNVWPKAGEAGISDIQYATIELMLAALGANEQGLLGEGGFTTSWGTGGGRVPTGADVRGSGIDVTNIANTAAVAATLEIEGDSLIEDLSVTNVENNCYAVLFDDGAAGRAHRCKASAVGGVGTLRAFTAYSNGSNTTLNLNNCRGYASGGTNNYAVYALDDGAHTVAVTVDRGYYAGDVVADGSGATINLNGPVITGSVTSLNSGTIIGYYYNANYQLVFPYDASPADGDVMTWVTANSRIEFVAPTPSGIPTNFRAGLIVEYVDAGNIRVGAGTIELNGSILSNITDSGLVALATAGNWVNGSEGASMWVYVYALDNGAGGVTIKLSDQPPLYPICDTASIVFYAQSNSNPAANATTFTCDNDTGEANVRAGDILRAWTDSAYGTVRGGYRVDSYTSATNTFVVEANDVNLADNDYLTIVKGLPRYRQYSGVWYRCLGAVRNDAASNVIKFETIGNVIYYDNPQTDTRILNGGTATSFTTISAATTIPPFAMRSILSLQNLRAGNNILLVVRATGSSTIWHTYLRGYGIFRADTDGHVSPNQALDYYVTNAADSGIIDVKTWINEL